MAEERPVVIAHRGASGYLPEHTLEGVALAHAMGVDHIEQDVVLTRDDELIVLHDLFLDHVTDVAERFPGRSREDGKHYAIDFSVEEIRTLRVHERTGDDGKAVFPGRFPHRDALFRIPTFREEITLIQGLNRSRGKQTGVYVEPKAPAWHEAEGKDIIAATIEQLAESGYRRRSDRAFLQSFDLPFLQRARTELKTDLKLVQLIGENSWGENDCDFDAMRTPGGLQKIAGFADGIGPWLPHVIRFTEAGLPDISDLVRLAHEAGLFVHAYTLRADQLPPAAGDIRTAARLLFNEVGLDGVFTDHPDRIRG
jgi:glycerophosphoryl diester phosphodiesterase